MRKQHHYTSKEEIMAVIDEAIRAMKTAEQEGLYHQKMAGKYIRDSAKLANGEAAFRVQMADEETKKSEVCIKKASRIQGKLDRLKRTLAAFKTGDLFGNAAVTLEK